jgi:surface antigen
MRRAAALPLVLALAACAGGQRAAPALGRVYPGLSCVPFARALTGFALAGDAADWWDAAGGRYARAFAPRVGAVLVFRRSDRLASGHVSVVSDIVDARRIRVIQANWVPAEMDLDQLVVDVSEDNDWTLVRVWYPPVNQLGGHDYPTYGFILPPSPLGHDTLAARAGTAARVAAGGG